MSNFWRWFFGIIAGLAVIGILLAGRSDRQAYRIARNAINQRTEITNTRIETAVEKATASVDTALQLAGNLPSQQAKADLIKADIEEIGNRLKELSEARGDMALDKLNQSIDQFNTTLQAVEDASKETTDPQAKAALDQIYSTLLAGKDRLTQFLLHTQR